jgi:hypothetical protein
MPFKIEAPDRVTQDLWIADRRLWLTADRSQAVEDGDSRAAFLLVAPGQSLPLAKATELKLVAETKEDAPVLKEKEKPEDKEREKPEDKQLTKPVTKSRKKATRKKKVT